MLGLKVFFALMLLCILSIHSLSNSDLISHANSVSHDDNEGSNIFQQPARIINPQPPIENTNVEIVKSFKNSTGFYKINGTIENQGTILLSDIKVIKYYKIPWVDDTTLVCYEQDIVNCQYKSINNQLPPKSSFIIIPPAPSETYIDSNWDDDDYVLQK